MTKSGTSMERFQRYYVVEFFHEQCKDWTAFDGSAWRNSAWRIAREWRTKNPDHKFRVRKYVAEVAR
jgi:hypothetical protein